MVQMILKRGGHTSILIGDPEVAVDRIVEEQPELVILDVMMPEISGHDLCEQIRATEEIAHIPVLMLTARSQAIDRQAALESGADDFLSKPVRPRDLMEHVDRLLAEAAPAQEGQIISLFSTRGGVGRTTLAVNLAGGLRRVSEQQVCLVDLSPSGGQAALHLRLQPRETWASLPTPDSLEWPTLKEHLLLHQSGLRLLAAPPEPQPSTSPSEALVKAVLALLRERMLFTVLDLPPLLSPAVMAALAASDIIFHVIAPEVVSLRTAVHSNKLLRDLEADAQLIYLLNQHMPDVHVPAKAVSRMLESRRTVRVDYDSRQHRALSQGTPIILSPAESPLPTAVGPLVSSLWKHANADGDTAEEGAIPGRSQR